MIHDVPWCSMIFHDLSSLSSCWILSLCTAIRGCISESLYFNGQALSSSKTPYQVLKHKIPKTIDLDNDDEYTKRTCWITFTFMLHVWFFTPGHYPEESTMLGENPLKEQTPAAWYHTLFTKIKASPPLHLQPPWAPPAGYPLLPRCCWRKSQGDLHPGKILRITSPPPVLHPLNSDASHLVSPVH